MSPQHLGTIATKVSRSDLLFSGCAMILYEIFSLRILTASQIFNSPLALLPLLFVSFSAGGLALYLWPERNLRNLSYVGFPLSILILFVSAGASQSQWVLTLAISIPIFFLGLQLASGFNELPIKTASFYECLGACAGALFAMPLLRILGLESSLLALAFAFSLKAYFLKAPPKLMPTLSVALFAALLALQSLTDDLNFFKIAKIFQSSTNFETVPGILNFPGVKLLTTQWSGISRVDLIESPFNPWELYFRRYEEALKRNPIKKSYNLYFDNDLFSSFPDPNSGLRLYSNFVQAPEILMFGVAGGYRADSVLRIPGSKVTGVEINPSVVNIMQGKFSDLSNNIYKKMELHVGDARHFLETTKRRFDVIDMGGVGFSSSLIRANLPMHSLLFTKESLSRQLKILKPGGLIFQDIYGGPDRLRLARLILTWREALKDSDLNPSENIIVVEADSGFSFFGMNTTYIIIKKDAFEERELKSYMDTFEAEPDEGFPVTTKRLLYAPNKLFNKALFNRFLDISDSGKRTVQLLQAIISNDNWKSFAADLGFDNLNQISILTDDSPFTNVITKNERVDLSFSFYALAGLILMLIFSFKDLGASRQFLQSKRRALLTCVLLGVPYALQQIYWVYKINYLTGNPVAAFLVSTLGMLAGSALASKLPKTQSVSVQALMAGCLAVLTIVFAYGSGKIPFLMMDQFETEFSLVFFLMMIAFGFLGTSLFIPAMESLKDKPSDGSSLGYALNCLSIAVTGCLGVWVAQSYGFHSIPWLCGAFYLIMVGFQISSSLEA